jgi:hypothetical protein
MTMMYNDEAREIIEQMRDTAVSDAANLTRRIAELKQELPFDGWEETAAQIQRLEVRLENRVREAKALSVAAAQFAEKQPVEDTKCGTWVTVVKTSHDDLLGRNGLVQRITPSGNYEVVFGNEVAVLGPDQVKRA